MRSIFPTHTSIMLLRNLICVCLLAFLTTVGFAHPPSGQSPASSLIHPAQSSQMPQSR